MTVDCKRLFVTAGFWNSHVHILPPALLHARDSGAPELQEQLDTMFNRWGFTSVFDLSSVLENTQALRGRIESNALRGPRLLTVASPYGPKSPHMFGHFSVKTTSACPTHRAPTRRLLSCATMPQPVPMASSCSRARSRARANPTSCRSTSPRPRLRKPTGTRCRSLPIRTTCSAALESGVDVLAHTVPDSPPWEAMVTQLREAKMALIPTLTLFDGEVRKMGGSDADREALVGRMVAELRAYSQAGGDIVFGTDIGYTDHFDTTMEYELMSRAGMDFHQILASLTTTPARRFGYANRSGRIATGMEADLVVLGVDPAKDVTAFSKVRYAIRKGRLTYSPGTLHPAGAGQGSSSY